MKLSRRLQLKKKQRTTKSYPVNLQKRTKCCKLNCLKNITKTRRQDQTWKPSSRSFRRVQTLSLTSSRRRSQSLNVIRLRWIRFKKTLIRCLLSILPLRRSLRRRRADLMLKNKNSVYCNHHLSRRQVKTRPSSETSFKTRMLRTKPISRR